VVAALLAVVGLALLGWAFVMRRGMERSPRADAPVHDWPDDDLGGRA
jgi:hypothetical protein